MASIMADEAYDDVAEFGDVAIAATTEPGPLIFDLFPPVTWGEDSVWRRRAARAFDDLAADLDAGREPEPTCTGEEMALHLILRRARDMHFDGETDHLVVGVEAQLRDRDWATPMEDLFVDHDVLTLFESTSLAATEFLDPKNWFVPFDKATARDSARGYRR